MWSAWIFNTCPTMYKSHMLPKTRECSNNFFLETNISSILEKTWLASKAKKAVVKLPVHLYIHLSTSSTTFSETTLRTSCSFTHDDSQHTDEEDFGLLLQDSKDFRPSCTTRGMRQSTSANLLLAFAFLKLVQTCLISRLNYLQGTIWLLIYY